MKKQLCVCLVCLVLLTSALPCAAAGESNPALLSVLGGDVNGDWAVTTSDARALFKTVSGQAGGIAAAVADADRDGEVTTLDVVHIMELSLGRAETALALPAVNERDTEPAGEAVPFTIAAQYTDQAEFYSRSDEVWVAQSLDELEAIYAHSDAKTRDFTEGYTAEFFEDNAVIVWAMYRDGYLVGMQLDGVIKNGKELCFRRTLYNDQTQVMYYGQRYILEVSKEDLVGVETLSKYTEEYIYSLL